MTDCIDINLERLTAAASAPYGWLLEASGAPLRGQDWPMGGCRFTAMRPCGCGSCATIACRCGSLLWRGLSRSPKRAALLVTRPLSSWWQGILRRTRTLLRCGPFFLDGQTGVMFRKGVWHGPDCFPARDAHVHYLVLGDTATGDEIEAHEEARQGLRTHLHVFAAQESVGCQVIDTHGEMAG